MELLKERRGHFLYIPFILFTVYCLLCFTSMYSVLNTLSEHAYFYISKTLYTSYTFLIVLGIVESQQCILKNKYTFTSYQKTLFHIDYQTISVDQNNMFSNILYIYTIQWGWLGAIFGIFHDLLTHGNHPTIWHPEYMALCPHSFD